jgi:excisionase family DNA binding protein
MMQALRPGTQSPGVTERLLTAREVSDRLGVSIEWTLRHYRSGELPGFRIGQNVRPVRFRWSEIEAWLEDCRNSDRTGTGASESGAPH